MRLALKIAYDGRAFHGFARQPDVRTVEGEILRALMRAGAVRDLESSGLRGASRTDAGVSALGNVVAFDPVTDRGVVGRFNHVARDVWAWAEASVDSGFDPRRARQRWYRYVLDGDHDVGSLRDALAPFVGDHDFRAFASPDAQRTRRRIDSIEVAEDGDAFSVDVRGPSFLRGMVRRIVSAALAVERGDASPSDLRRALDRGTGPDLGSVPPEPLTLMDVDLGVAFRPVADRATRLQVLSRRARAEASARFWSEAAKRVLPPGGDGREPGLPPG